MSYFVRGVVGALTLCASLAGCGGGAVSETDGGARKPVNLATVEVSATPVVIHMLGDSTMTKYTEDRRPQMGWGEAMPQYFNSSATVNNWALGGRSSRSFYYESTRWPAILPKINAGEYVIIQFAHNDQKSGSDYAQYATYAFCSDGTTDGEACTGRPDKVDPAVDISQHSYYQFLKKYVSDVRGRGANPILMTPIVRKYFSGTTITPQGQHNVGIIGGETFARGDYVAAMKAVAAKYNVPLVDLTAQTKQIVESYGNTIATADLYISADSTHPQVLFANMIAKRATEGLKALNILNSYIVPVTSVIPTPYTLDWSNQTINTSASRTVTLGSFDLSPTSGTVTAMAPANFDVSLDGTSWAKSVNISYTNGGFITPLYVRFTPTALQAYSALVTFSLSGVTLKNTLAVKGTGVTGTTTVASAATWYTASDSPAPVLQGLVTASNAIVSNLAEGLPKVLAVDGQDTTVARYVADSPTRNTSQYLQFAVGPSSGTFTVDTISAYLTSSGGSTVVADIEYSLHSDFSASIKLNASPLTFTKDIFTKLSYPVNFQVPLGQKVYVRIYPWNSAAFLGKMLAVYGVKVAGKATNQ